MLADTFGGIKMAIEVAIFAVGILRDPAVSSARPEVRASSAG